MKRDGRLLIAGLFAFVVLVVAIAQPKDLAAVLFAGLFLFLILAPWWIE